MSTGRIEAIFLAPALEAPMVGVAEARALAGRGLEGDRYCAPAPDSAAPPPDAPPRKPGKEITLIEAESLEALHRDYGIELAPAASRRNLLVRGAPLNHYVGREFSVGAVRLRGIRLCEPCARLEAATRPGVLKGLVHRGGLRAHILTDGILHVGDLLSAPSDAPAPPA